MPDKMKKAAKRREIADIKPEESSEMNMEWEGNPPSLEPTIPERAYYYWEQEGRPEGKSLEHWLRAEREAREDRANEQ